MTDRVFFTSTLADAFAQAGLEYPVGIDTGRNSRFSTNGRPNDTSGYLRPFPDGKGAVFGCWRSGMSFVWQQRLDGASKPSSDEIKQAKKQAAIFRKQAEQERDELHAKTADMLQVERTGLPLATNDHGYLVAREIQLYGDIRLGQKGQLNIPVYDGDGRLQSVQDIYPPNRLGKSFKQFAKDAKTQGGRFVFGELVDGEPITLGEGYSTSASMFQSGIGAVVCCFFGANLAPVAADLRRRYPNSFIRVGGDLDSHGKGAEYAKAAVAAAMPNSGMVLPAFSDDRDSCDYNDLHRFTSLEEVRNQLESCKPVERDLSGLSVAGEADSLPNIQVCVAPSLAVADVRDGTNNTRPLTEVGNALRMFDHYSGILRYVYDVKGWLVWRNGAWTWDISGSSVRATAASLSTTIYNEGNAVDMVQAEFCLKWARKSQDARTIDAAVSLLSDQEPIRLSLSMIDADPMMIGFDHARKVIDLRTGIARPAAPTDYITKSLTPCAIGDASKAVRWHSFLEQIFDGDKELIDWLHRWCGYLLTGSTSEQILLFLFGLGANGKSVFAELLKHIMGDYGRSVASETECGQLI